jgi:hypothetical protein
MVQGYHNKKKKKKQQRQSAKVFRKGSSDVITRAFRHFDSRKGSILHRRARS